MIDFSDFITRIRNTPLEKHKAYFEQCFNDNLSTKRYGDLPAWLEALDALPAIDSQLVDSENSVTLSPLNPLTLEQEQIIEESFRKLIPWRKGPFNVFNFNIDTEWRSDWKWDRLIKHLSPLEGKNVLDVGCGSGYHCWRMLGENARTVVGIDPSPRFVVQFYMIKNFLKTPTIDVLPLTLEQFPKQTNYFDTAFSMGVLYHRRSPIEHILAMKDTLKSGGELVLETLVIDGKLGEVLVPEDRYASMPNVWFLPSVETLLSWLRKCGFKDAKCIDVSVTSIQEQRKTEWMTYQSLEDFLDPNDHSLTKEGLPAPLRAVITAQKP
ncbi:MAG: tRNA (mo5U34)-methyltransferase [Flavobacteriales bacterium]|jgi:tRNA (mo5U34)-methyltransferase